MGWKPSVPGERPTLGNTVIDWCEYYLQVVDGPSVGEPLRFTEEQIRFILKLYEVDPGFDGRAVDGRTVNNGRLIRRAVLSRSKGWGKAERLDAPIPTPQGWTTVGEIRPGDELFDADGAVVRCVATHPVTLDCGYRVTLSDGTSSVFHGEHLFDVDVFVGGPGRVRKTLSVAEMRDEGLVYPRPLTTGRTKAVTPGVSRFALPPQPVLQLPDADLPVDPYLFGAWLGDGDSNCPRLTCGAEDLPHMLAQIEAAGVEHGEPAATSTAWRVRFGRGWAMRALRDLNVVGNKHIPQPYLRASVEQRLALLQGLMDTDGHIARDGTGEFCTVRRDLADGVAELIRTLGMRVSVRQSDAVLNGRVVGTRYRLKFKPYADLPVVRLPRKVERLAARNRRPLPRVIKSIEPVGDTAMRCITVSSPDGLYLTGESMWVTHNSPIVAALCIVEAIGPVVMDGWDADGQPVGRPWWTTGIKPKVQIVAVSEDQTANTWEPCLDMVRSSNTLLDDYDVTPMETAILVPSGKIEAATSAGLSREGFRPVFTAMDQTESWTESNGGWKLARTIRRNIAKVNGCSVETPNAFLPGEESVAEASWKAFEAQREGRARSKGLLFDHREAPAETDPEDYDSLRAGLREAYGDSASDNGGWVNLDRIIAEYWDADTDPQDARRYFLNQLTHASDSWVSQQEWSRIRAEYLPAGADFNPDEPLKVRPLADGDAITIGFDGSMGRVQGKADATALIGCRIYDGHLFELGVWEADLKDRKWAPPVAEIDAAVRDAFKRYRVMAMYADPSGWVEHVAAWEKDHGRKLRVRCSVANPMMAWPKGKGVNVVEHVERLRHAIVVSGQKQDGELKPEVTHDGSLALTRHVLNARMRPASRGYLIYKAYPESPQKIDAAYAAVMAYKARLDCVARGFGVRVNTSSKGRMLVLQ